MQLLASFLFRSRFACAVFCLNAVLFTRAYAQVDSTDKVPVPEKAEQVLEQEKATSPSAVETSPVDAKETVPIPKKKSFTLRKKKRISTPFSNAIIDRLSDFEATLLPGYEKAYKNLYPEPSQSQEQEKGLEQKSKWSIVSFFDSRTNINVMIVLGLVLIIFYYRLRNRE